MTKANWIYKWSEINDDKKYVCAALTDKGRLYEPQFLWGWEVKRRIERVYLALEIPDHNVAWNEIREIEAKVKL